MAKMIGIDLGTTNSVVAVMEGPRPKILDSREGRPLTRSVVSLKRRKGGSSAGEGEILVGDVAFDNWPTAPKDTIVSIKRLMGRGMADPEVQRAREWSVYAIVEPSRGTKDSVRVVMGGKEYSPVEISAMILKKLADDAEFKLGERPTHAVITVPAYFSFAQKAATRQAGEKAGLRVTKILDEPTAAAVAHGIESGDSQAKTILVYDFGGGTFDVSVLMMVGGVFAPLNLQGDMWLGGDDLDEVIVDKAVRYVQEEFGVDPTSNFRFMVALKKAAQAVKERLSAASSADLMVPGLLRSDDGDLIDVELEVTRDEFERMILPLVATYKECACGQANFPTDDRCAKCGASLQDSPVKDGKTVQIVRKALQNADLTSTEIDHVLMAGNSTIVPLVQQAMEEMFGGEKILRTIQPKQCVAVGAAIVAAGLGVSEWVCQAPDRSDPSGECGHTNKWDTEVCEKCGTRREVEREEPEAEAREVVTGEIDIGGIQIGGVAPFHYGAEVAGDKFIIFVRKGDSVPTENPQVQTFFTRMPNQSMISIPIWGGEELERASANTKQGEAFVILPPGLSKGTPVRVELSLDDEGGPVLKAYLEDGTDLQAWIVKGEEDAKAIESIEKVEKLPASMGDAIPPQERHKLEEARNRAFERLRQRDFDGALEEAEGISRPAEPTLQAKAESLIGFTEYVLHQYNWALEPNQAYRLSELVEETKSALEQGDEAKLEEKVRQLDEATDNLPEAISVFLGLKGAIASRIQPRDVAQAASLLQELEGVENAFKSRDPAARLQLVAFAEKVVEAIKHLEEQRIAKCPVPACGCKLEPGQRYCEKGHDTWQVGQGVATTSGEQAMEPKRGEIAALGMDEASEARHEETPSLLGENVEFTVYRPRSVQPEKWYPLLAFAHLGERPPDAGEDERDPIEEVRTQAKQILGKRVRDYGESTQPGKQAVPRHGELTFLPEIPGVEFNPPRRTFLWLESVHREEFRLRASPELDGRTARGSLMVFLGSILIADVALSIRVDSSSVSKSKTEAFDSDSTRPYRSIFPSYSHRDVAIVEEFERYASALGDRYLRDVIVLRAGQDWRRELKQKIEEADVFQLFWSWNSMYSAFVEQEWRYAMSLDRPHHFVRPVYWEDPLPESEDRPPEELKRLHFQRIPPSSGAVATEKRQEPPEGPSAETSARGDLDGAMALHKEEERLCRELGSKDGLQASLSNQANILYARGDLDGAMALHKEQERLCRELGSKDGLQASRGNQANILYDEALEEALGLVREAIEGEGWDTAVRRLREVLRLAGNNPPAELRRNLATCLANRAVQNVNRAMDKYNAGLKPLMDRLTGEARYRFRCARCGTSDSDYRITLPGGDTATLCATCVGVIQSAHKPTAELTATLMSVEKDLREAVQLDPSNDRVRDNLSRLKEIREQMDEAATSLRVARSKPVEIEVPRPAHGPQPRVVFRPLAAFGAALGVLVVAVLLIAIYFAGC